MAANIFTSADYDGIQTRIHQLNAQSQRRWGKMSLPQMLVHCSIQLQKGLGIMPASAYEGPAFYRGRFGRWLLLYALPWPKGAATPAQMNMLTNHSPVLDTAEAKQTLLDLLAQMQAQDRLHPHPFLGDMNKKDWGRLIWKHLDHHLRQFSV